MGKTLACIKRRARYTSVDGYVWQLQGMGSFGFIIISYFTIPLSTRDLRRRLGLQSKELQCSQAPKCTERRKLSQPSSDSYPRQHAIQVFATGASHKLGWNFICIQPYININDFSREGFISYFAISLGMCIGGQTCRAGTHNIHNQQLAASAELYFALLRLVNSMANYIFSPFYMMHLILYNPNSEL